MMNKQKVIVISSYSNNIRQLTSLYLDTTVHTSYQKFEEYIADSPVDVTDIIISSIELPYSNKNMEKIINLVKSKYIFISHKVYYLVTDETTKEKVDLILKGNDIDNVECLVLDSLYEKDILDVIQGKVFTQKDTVVEIKTYRIKVSDFNKVVNQLQDNDLKFDTDEETLSEIEDIQPEEVVVSDVSRPCYVKTIASDDITCSSIWSIINAQYLSISSRVLLIEHDVEYHSTYDFLLKSGVQFSFYDINDIYRDVSLFIKNVKNDLSRFIFVGAKKRIKYSYRVLFDLLYYNLRFNFDYMIKAIPLLQLSKSVKTEIVLRSSVPEVLKSAKDLIYSPNFKFFAINTNDYIGVSLYTSEFKALLERLLKVNGIDAHTVNIRGLRLSEGGLVSGLLSKD